MYEKKWLVGSALNSRAQCKDTKCLYEDRKIGKGELRVGRRFPSAFQKDEIAINWFHAKCIFSQQLRSRETTQVIEHEDDMDGFGDLLLAEQHQIRDLIQGNVDIKYGGSPLPNATPAKVRTSVGGKTPTKKEKKSPGSGRRDTGRILML